LGRCPGLLRSRPGHRLGCGLGLRRRPV